MAGKEQEASWTRGVRSVLDVNIEPEKAFPIQPDPPVGRYLEEVMIGMKGGLGDPAADAMRQRTETMEKTKSMRSTHNGDGEPMAHSKSIVERRRGVVIEEGDQTLAGGLSSALSEELAKVRAERMNLLGEILDDDPAKDCCRALFWLVLGGMFRNTVHVNVMQRFREVLGEGWTAIARELQANPLLHGRDRPVKDWVIGSMPFVFAQAIFRLMCDGFPDDRKHLVAQADELVVRAVYVVHFELLGFQIVADTVRRSRKRLFLKQAARNPYMDQREVLKGQKQQKLLDSDSNANGPLVFGNLEGNPLQENQLEHILKAHKETLTAWNAAKDKGKALPLETPVPNELSVDRYEGVSGVGVHLFDSHMQLMCRASGDDPSEMEGKAHFIEAFLKIDVDGSGGIDEYEMSTALQNLGFNMTQDQVKQMIDEVDDDGNGEVGLKEFLRIMANLESAGGGDEESHDSGSAHGHKGHDEGEEDSDLDIDANLEDAGGGDEDAPKSPKSRDNTKDADEGKDMKKMWKKGISVAKLANAGVAGRGQSKRERERKQKQEALMKKTVTEPLPKELMTRELTTTWVSPPMMRKVKAPDRLMLRKTPAETYHVSMAVGVQRSASTPALDSQRQAMGRSMGSPSKGSKEEGGLAGRSSFSTSATTGSLPMLRTKPMQPAQFKVQEQAEGDEVIVLHPPVRLAGKMVMSRLENEGRAFQQKSFSHYVKEADVMSGGKKQQFDGSRLKNEEFAYIQKVGGLVGGVPKKLIPPETMLARNFRNRNRGPAEAPKPPGSEA
mmetsp:Transcript_22549/g.59530  ORF Transcript_22549/g.59530 Transcript_22549/m.59530 type:complete len:783 (-) Transcript_22549:203-2551(-)